MRILGKKSIIACCATALLSGVLPLSAPVSAVIIGGYVAPFRNVDKQSVSDLAINQSTGEVFAVGRTFTATTATNPISNVPSRNAAGFLSKIDVNGRIVWSKQIGRSLRSAFDPMVALDSRGNIYATIVERSELANGIFWDVVVEKWSSAGTRVWQRVLGGDSNSYDADITVNTQGVYVVYSSNNVQLGGIGGLDVVVQRLDPLTGSTIRAKLFGSVGSDFPRGITTTSSGDIAIVGSTNGRIYGTRVQGRVDEDYFLAQFTSDLGTLKLGRQWGTRDNDRASGVLALPGGGFAVTGLTAGQPTGTTNRGGTDGTLMRIGSTGNELWTILIGSASEDLIAGVAISPANGNIMVAGTTSGITFGASAGQCDIISASYTQTGALVGSKQFGTSACDSATAIVSRSNGSPVFGGWTFGSFDSTPANDIDGYVFSAGIDIPNITQFVGTQTNIIPIPLPNPFPLLVNASEQNAAVGSPMSAAPVPLCNEATSPTVRWRREVATCAGLTVKRGTTTKIRLSLQNKAGVCSLTPRRRLKLNAAGTCKVRIRATQSNGSTKAVWMTYKVS